ncbi:hypothetical protein TNCV_1360731 [Trichonephila clavipes]|nr:hypothetical protein TNCV_1360731 [Trichonephila clavipes]
MNAAELFNDGASTSAAGAVEVMQMDDEIASILTLGCVGINCVLWSFMKTHWAAINARFTTAMFIKLWGVSPLDGVTTVQGGREHIEKLKTERRDYFFKKKY